MVEVVRFESLRTFSVAAVHSAVWALNLTMTDPTTAMMPPEKKPGGATGRKPRQAARRSTRDSQNWLFVLIWLRCRLDRRRCHLRARGRRDAKLLFVAEQLVTQL